MCYVRVIDSLIFFMLVSKVKYNEWREMQRKCSLLCDSDMWVLGGKKHKFNNLM